MPTSFSYDVFLSYNHNDKPRVRRLAERLQQAGLTVWFDDWRVKAGEIIALKVEEGLEQSRVLLLCISPNALASGWVALERSTAIHRDPTNEGRRFIPLLLVKCELPDTLKRYKYVDITEETEEGLAEVITACQREAPAAPEAELEPKQEFTGGQIITTTISEGSKELAELEAKVKASNWVKSLAVSPDGKWLCSGHSTNELEIWELQTLAHVASLSGHTRDVDCVAFMPDGKSIVSGSRDSTLRLWSTETKLEVRRWEDHHSFILGVCPLNNPNQVASVGNDSTLRMWNIVSGECLANVSVENTWRGAVTRDWKHGLIGRSDGGLDLWDLQTSKPKTSLSGHSGTVCSVDIARDGSFAVSGSADTTVKIWDLATLSCIGTLEGHRSQVQSVATSADGALIASAGFIDHSVRLWDRASGECLQTINESEEFFTPTAVAFSIDRSWLVVGTAEGWLYTYHLKRVQQAPSVTSARRYVNAKVVLLGEGTVGKTSLAHRLIEDKYVVLDRTHGMNVWRLDLPLPPDATLEREALLWDLAGQDDYRLIHQLFLHETALALLLINPQKDDPFAEAGDWLKALKAVPGSSEGTQDIAKLLVFSQTDVGGMKLGDAKIQRFSQQYGFADWIATSAKTGENCSDEVNAGQPSKLKKLIAERIPWEKLPWTSTPQLLTELKNAVTTIRDEHDIRLLRFAELTQRLEQALPGEKFAESDVRTAVTLLANQGLARALKFGDLILLQPELLNGYAGAIIRAARANKDEIGSVLEADIYRPDFDFTGVKRLKHRPDEELLLRALVQTFLDHSLCIAEDLSNGRHLVFPSQYRRDKDIPHDPDIFVSYTFSGEWQTVWSTLIVRLWYSQEFEHKELWRNAAEFASPKGFTLGLKIDNKQGEGTATVSLYFDNEVPDELKVIFIEYVHRHLAKFGCEVSRDRRYVCQVCGKPVLDLDAVRKRLDAKKDFIYCQHCDSQVPLIDFVEQRLKTDRVARKILAMDQKATRALDTQALEQILIGHMMATCGEANQIFRELPKSDYGIDAEVEFKDNDGNPSGKKIYVQLKSGNSYLRTLRSDGSEVFDVKNEQHRDYWLSQPIDVYLVIRQTDEVTGAQTIRWMNVSSYLKNRQNKNRIVFEGEKLDMEAVWKVRDQFFPKTQVRK